MGWLKRALCKIIKACIPVPGMVWENKRCSPLLSVPRVSFHPLQYACFACSVIEAAAEIPVLLLALTILNFILDSTLTGALWFLPSKMGRDMTRTTYMYNITVSSFLIYKLRYQLSLQVQTPFLLQRDSVVPTSTLEATFKPVSRSPLPVGRFASHSPRFDSPRLLAVAWSKPAEAGGRVAGLRCHQRGWDATKPGRATGRESSTSCDPQWAKSRKWNDTDVSPRPVPGPSLGMSWTWRSQKVVDRGFQPGDPVMKLLV